MKIKIIKRIVPESPVMKFKPIETGIYDAMLNPLGAVSVKSDDGEFVGVKLDEFEFLTVEDRNEWVNIAHPNIPKVMEHDEQDGDEIPEEQMAEYKKAYDRAFRKDEEKFGIVNIIDSPEDRHVKQVSLLVLDFESDEKKNNFIQWLEDQGEIEKR